MQAKINMLCVEFQELSNGAWTCQVIVWGTLFFSRQMCIFGFFTKKIVKRDLQATCDSVVYQSSQMLYFSARNLGIRFKLRFYHCTQCRRDASFHVFGKKNAQKDQCKISLGAYFRTAENTVVLCKNFDTEGKIHFVVALSVSVATSEGSDLS